MWWLDDITDSMDMSLSKLREIAKDGEDWCVAVRGVAKSRTRLSDSTTETTHRLDREGLLERLTFEWKSGWGCPGDIWKRASRQREWLVCLQSNKKTRGLKLGGKGEKRKD